MNKILASKNSERKDLRGRVQRLEQQLEEKDLVSFLTHAKFFRRMARIPMP